MAQPELFVRLLSANPFFSAFEPQAMEAVASLCVTRSLAAEEVLRLVVRQHAHQQHAS